MRVKRKLTYGTLVWWCVDQLNHFTFLLSERGHRWWLECCARYGTREEQLECQRRIQDMNAIAASVGQPLICPHCNKEIDHL